MHDDYKPNVTDWTSMLSISTRLNFQKVRERSIKEITGRLEEIVPFDLIGLAVKYDIQQWLMPAYRRIVTMDGLITHAEAQKIPFPMAVMLMRSRELYWDKRHAWVHYATRPDPLFPADHIIDSEVTLMEHGPATPCAPCAVLKSVE